MVQEDRKILNTIWYRKHKWMSRVIWHDGILHDIRVLEGRMLDKTTRGRRRIQLVDDLTKNYADLKKAAEGRSVWRTITRDCHKPVQ